MTVGVFQLLQAKRDQVETARGYVESRRDYWLARAALDQLLAGRMLRSAPEIGDLTSDGIEGGGTPARGSPAH